MPRTICDATSDLIWSVDLPDFKLTWWNRSLEDAMWGTFGIVPESGMAPGDLFRDGYEAQVWVDYLSSALDGGEVSFEREDIFGALRSFRIIPMVAQGEITGLAVVGRDITKRLAAKAAHEAAEATFKRAFMAVPDALYMATVSDGLIVQCNPAFERVFGFSREEIIGASSQDLAIWLDAGAKEEFVKKVREAGFVLDFGTTFRRKSGDAFPATVSACLVQFDGEDLIVSTIRDVSGLREATDKVRLLQFSLDHVDEMISLADGDGRLISINDYGCKRTGFSREELLGRMGPGLFVQERFDRDEIEELLGVDGTATGQVEMLTKTGEVWPGEVTLSSIEFGGERYYCFFIRDITERKKSERDLAEALAGVQKAQVSTIEVLSSITELHDPYTAGHQRGVARIALEIARQLELGKDRMRGLEVAALLHDIGKACVPIEILSFPGALTPARRHLVQRHSEAGYELLKAITFPWPVAQMVLQHHERSDGSGYPRGLTGEELLTESKILAVADTVEAMGAHRPHRHAFEPAEIRNELQRLRGTAYDADVVDAFLALDPQPGSVESRPAAGRDTRA
jgi:PAS domain S-box-containing protein/putative nucleotidyltransferase with HDIG domain